MRRRDSKEYKRNRLIVLKANNYKCCICGEAANTADHILEKVYGGSDKLSNLRSMCLSCNSSRGAQVRNNPKRFNRINNKWF